MTAFKSEISHNALTKIPEVTLVFWIIKIAATTLGETGGNSVTMTLNWGYLTGTAIFLAALVILVATQIFAKRFHKLETGTVSSTARWPPNPQGKSGRITRGLGQAYSASHTSAR